jgi:hypothetical protein
MKKYYLISVSFNCMVKNGALSFGYVADEQNPLSNKKIKEIVLSQIKGDPSSFIPTIEDLQVITTNIFKFENEQEYKAFWQ